MVEGDIKEIDMGKVNDNYFINHVGMGLDYYVVKNAENFKFVPLAFVLSVFYSISREKPWDIKLEIDNKVKYEGSAWLVTACNGKYFGGGMKAAPDAELDDGFFDIILAKGISKIKFVGNFSKVFRGKHLEVEGIEFFRGKNVAVKCAKNVGYEINGELISEEKEINVKIIEKALKIRV